MKFLIITITILISSNSYALFEKKPEQIAYEKREKELHQIFGEKMVCYNAGHTTSICENKIHLCYKDTVRRRGGMTCMLKRDLKNHLSEEQYKNLMK